MTDQIYDTVKLDLAPGSLWNYCPLGKMNGSPRVGPYRVIGTGDDIRTGQELILFQRCHPPGTVKNFVAPLSMFEVRFEAIEEPVEAVPDKHAGVHQLGSGV